MRSISAAPTSVAAFVGKVGSVRWAVPRMIGSMAEFERAAGPTALATALGRAVGDFFRHGGRKAWVAPVWEGDFVAALKRFEGIEFNLLSLPPGPEEAVPVEAYRRALDLCVRKRALLLVDPLIGTRTGEEALGFREALGFSEDAARNAALYFPALEAVPHAPSGAVAGLIAALDERIGVWKALAGTDAALRVSGPSIQLNDDQNRVVNEHGINAIRSFPGKGTLVWGARTMASGEDDRYVPVRRLALRVEASVAAAEAWTRRRRNDETLWKELRGAAEDFLFSLWRAGAFPGKRPEQASFVRCDRTTMTQDDLDRGRLIVEVGIAPVRSAEFVILRIGLAARPARTGSP